MMTARSKVIAPITSPYMQRVRERQRENIELWQEEQERARSMGEQVSDVNVETPGARDRTMHALSVKRRRALKMKKHKYKKLMDKTRNQRRRLEKQ